MKRNRGYFRDALRYVYETRYFILTAVALFFVSAIFGYFFSHELSFLDQVIKQIIDMTEGLNALQLIIFIFQNNTMSAFYAFFFGIVLGVAPALSSAFNGLVLGYVFARASSIGGLQIIWRLLPHGIFELPAVFISIGMGMRLGMFVFSKDKKKEFLYRLNGSLKAFISIVVPLLIVAAIIEGLLIVFFK